MADILHDLPIKASPSRVFAVMVTPQGLDQWWTLRASGRPEKDSQYGLLFGSEYDWRAPRHRFVPNGEFEWEMTQASDDWVGIRIGLRLAAAGDLGPLSQVVRNNLAGVLLDMGEAEQGLTEAESIVSLAPSWAPGHLRMGEALARLKQPRDADRTTA